LYLRIRREKRRSGRADVRGQPESFGIWILSVVEVSAASQNPAIHHREIYASFGTRFSKCRNRKKYRIEVAHIFNPMKCKNTGFFLYVWMFDMKTQEFEG
jgi:hypothetical protein